MFAVLLAAFIAIGTITVTSQTPDKPRLGFLSALKAGQSVTLKEVAGSFEIMIDNDAGHHHRWCWSVRNKLNPGTAQSQSASTNDHTSSS